MPQIFYYDDFLGQTTLDQKFNKNEEQKLLDFIGMVRKSKNKRFILTTREYILNKAKTVYEKLARSNFDVDKCTIELKNYTRFERAKILFNHVYFSNLPEPFKHNLLYENNYLNIIQHRNYNPRIIEWMADFQNSEYIVSTNYISEFLANLENPSRIWEHAFENQLSEPAKHLLLVLASLPSKVFIEDLESAFNVFYVHTANKYGFARHSRDFKRALKELESNFLSINNVNTLKAFDLTIQFHNPSIQDFLDNYLRTNNDQINNIFESAIFFEQSNSLWTDVTKDIVRKMPNQFLNALHRTIESKACLLGNYYSVDTKRSYVNRYSVYFERRVIFALEITKDFKCNYSQQIFDRIIAILIKKLEQGSGNKKELLNLIEVLVEDGFRYVTDKEKFLKVVSSFFRSDLVLVEDYSYLLEYNNIVATDFLDMEFDKFSSEFHEMYEEEVASYLDNDDTDPDSIREFAVKLDDVASYFEIDVNDSLDDLEGWAKDLEDRSNEPDYDDDYRGSSGGSDDSLGAIEDLFDTLLD